MNYSTNIVAELDQTDEDILHEVSDETLEAAGTRTEIAGAWTFICTGIGCHEIPMYRPQRSAKTPDKSISRSSRQGGPRPSS